MPTVAGDIVVFYRGGHASNYAVWVVDSDSQQTPDTAWNVIPVERGLAATLASVLVDGRPTTVFFIDTHTLAWTTV